MNPHWGGSNTNEATMSQLPLRPFNTTFWDLGCRLTLEPLPGMLKAQEWSLTTLPTDTQVAWVLCFRAAGVCRGQSNPHEAKKSLTCFPSRAFWSLATVANTVAACSPPITEMRAFGHM